MTTIKDIAAKTNLSISTVSIVLNNRASRIPKSTRDIVINAAKELNYRPNQLAVGLVTKRTKTLGLIVPDIRNNFFSSLAKGIEDEARNNGWTVLLCNSNDSHKRDLEYIKMLEGKGVDGILYSMSSDSNLKNFKEKYSLIKNFDIKFLMIDRYLDFPATFPKINVVSLDHFKGGYLAAKHLIDLGHKKIACVTGPQYLSESNDRLRGYKQALDDGSIEYDEELIVEGNYHIESGVSAVNKLIEKDFTAIFAFNDMMAYGVLKGLKTYNLSIPHDISVIGYDDIYLSEILEVPLTTIHQPIEVMGRGAAKHFINIIDSKEEFLDNLPLYSPELIVRKSTSKPNKRLLNKRTQVI
ncbi:LacI family DNA-binding transcriptional regulator [Tissierella creatinophila]|uniref:HTH-type transcriptional regulator DegA n=1 Tax=Tissierella creatinophila DSM 6911 TaxID=1123403 RepID=A0A1U7M652_TISCR|nr:LacI family DNA-binding transcriptional regulator [Tissierella creatinophila]OLS02668.1 HTH-type transcriptional regulator DegA [Tissierella creatinophila DSM 6911]